MNKYKKYAYKTEDKNFVTEEAKLKLLILKFKIKALQYLNKEQIDLLFSFKTWKSFYYMIFELSTFNDEFQNYIINNIISKFSKEALIKYYMIGLCKFSTYENYDQVTKIINSFNSSKIIEDIKFDKEKII